MKTKLTLLLAGLMLAVNTPAQTLTDSDATVPPPAANCSAPDTSPVPWWFWFAEFPVAWPGVADSKCGLGRMATPFIASKSYTVSNIDLLLGAYRHRSNFLRVAIFTQEPTNEESNIVGNWVTNRNFTFTEDVPRHSCFAPDDRGWVTFTNLGASITSGTTNWIVLDCFTNGVPPAGSVLWWGRPRPGEETVGRAGVRTAARLTALDWRTNRNAQISFFYRLYE